MAKNIVEYLTPKGKVRLTTEDVKKYIISGDPNAVTDKELYMFLMICKYQKLNPFLREAYLIKYSKDQPASLVVGKDVYLKRASRNPKYQGHKTWCNYNEKGELVSATAQVFMKGYKVPIEVTVDLDEYIQRKADGTPTRFWKEKPKTMLKKVALSQALREAMPEEFEGTYTAEEMPGTEEILEDKGEVVLDDKITEEKKEQKKLTEKQKEILDLCQKVGYKRFEGKPVEEVISKISSKRADRIISSLKKKLQGINTLRENIVRLIEYFNPTPLQLKAAGIENTNTPIKEELQKYGYSDLKKIGRNIWEIAPSEGKASLIKKEPEWVKQLDIFREGEQS